MFLLLFINSSKADVHFCTMLEIGYMAKLNKATISIQNSHQLSTEKMPNFYLENLQAIISKLLSWSVILPFSFTSPFHICVGELI